MDNLIIVAKQARMRAYAPYSGFAVGAAVRCSDGGVFAGCNIENASYGLTVCAERNAIFAAVGAGCSDIEELAVVADTAEPVAPCGACRQVMAEFGIKTIHMANMQGAVCSVRLDELLPYAFGLKREQSSRE